MSETGELKTGREPATLRKAAVAAGIAYLFGIVYGVGLGFPVSSALVVPGSPSATFARIAAHELLYRVNSLGELIMYLSVVVLAASLYALAKSINRNLALLGLSLRVVEATVSSVAVLISYVALELLNGQAYLAAFTAPQLQAVVRVLLNAHNLVLWIVPVFFCTASIIFYGLFFKSRYVPRILAGFGVFAYSLFLVGDFVNLLTPGFSMAAILGSPFQIICAVPVMVFETAMGLWFLVKGVNVPGAIAIQVTPSAPFTQHRSR